MAFNYKKLNASIAIWIAAFGMILIPNLITPQSVDAKPKNKCKVVCKHKNKHGVCLIYGQDCGGSKVKKTKLYAISPDTSKDKEETKNKSGKNTCHHNDSPHASTTKKQHMDEDCCPDPDEWANPKCSYSVSGYAVMITKPEK